MIKSDVVLNISNWEQDAILYSICNIHAYISTAMYFILQIQNSPALVTLWSWTALMNSGVRDVLTFWKLCNWRPSERLFLGLSLWLSQATENNSEFSLAKIICHYFCFIATLIYKLSAKTLYEVQWIFSLVGLLGNQCCCSL